MNRASAFHEALTHEHATLMEELLQVERSLEAASSRETSDPVQLLSRLQVHVQDHFTFEEEGGYLALVRQRCPHQHRAIEELRQEHEQMGGTLAELIAEAKRARNGEVQGAAFRAKFHQLASRMRHHEARETRLMQEAVNREVSAED